MSESGDVRTEAERLVATALAAASMTVRTLTEDHQYATGSAECCVCPVCRLLTAMRDPSPELADRLSSAVGDLAAGVAGVLRALDTDGPPRQREGDDK